MWSCDCIKKGMATTPPVIQAKITSDPVKLPFLPLLAAVAIGVLVATASVGGLVYYLLRSGKIPIRGTVATPSEVNPAKTHMLALEPLLVNLADSSGGAYLRAGITLQVADPENVKEIKNAESKSSGKETDAAVRDTALMILGRQTSEQLLLPGGKEHLKKELKTALAEHNPEIKVMDLFFTEFLVQR